MQSCVTAPNKAGRVLASGRPIITYTCPRRHLHISSTLRNNGQQKGPESHASPPSKPGHHPGSQHVPPRRRQVGRFSLPVFLFFAFTFAAITSSMDTVTRPVSSPSPSHSAKIRHSPDQFDTDDMDASPQAGFVDDDGNPIVTAPLDEDADEEYGDVYGNKGGARDSEKERQEDTFGRHERHRRIPWTLREVAEAEKWQRDSRSAALRTEQGGRSAPNMRDHELE